MQCSRKLALKGLEQIAQGDAIRYDMNKNFRPVGAEAGWRKLSEPLMKMINGLR